MMSRDIPQLIPVDSSAIAAYGFDPETNLLYVQFHSGGTYAYESHQNEWLRFQRAESKGKFYHQNLGPRSGRRYVQKWTSERDEFSPGEIARRVIQKLQL